MTRLTAKKSLGQHFLIDPKAHGRIVRAIAPAPDDVLIEIGPGTGLLTRQLLQTPLKQLIAFELDARAIPLLTSEFDDARFEVVEADFLETDLEQLAKAHRTRLRVTGNIPYYITSPILFKLLDARASLRDATLLVQKEVAERLVARVSTKAYGIPTVLLNFFATAKSLFTVPAGAFRPAPNVDSAVVQIDFRSDFFSRTGAQRPVSFDEPYFRKLVRTLFAMRRKTVRNNLKTMLSGDEMAGVADSSSARFLDLRAEAMSLQDFFELYGAIKMERT